MPDGIILTNEQSAAVQMIHDNPISILTGGPGTGKTTTMLQVLDELSAQGLIIACAAPSGKAAKRMSEATGRIATTIHKLLDAHMENDRFVFERSSDMPLDADVVIIDEVSMISTDLFADLLQAIKETTKLVLIGDQDQLPSVGPGAVLRDLLASGKIPHINLTVIQRNSGEIVKVCHAIKAGKTFKSADVLDLDNGINYRHIECCSEKKIVKAITSIVTDAMPRRGYDPVWDVQVITPTNDKTSMSCQGLNKRLQQVLNPEEFIEGCDFKIGDKVINIKNKNSKFAFEDESITALSTDYINVVAETQLYNGDIGRIIGVQDNNLICEFFDPSRTVLMPKKNNDLLMAYAITCHRFQGSEIPVCIIPVHRAFQFICSRAWIYTAISRAKVICITVGEMGAIDKAVAKDLGAFRVTRLQEMLNVA